MNMYITYIIYMYIYICIHLLYDIIMKVQGVEIDTSTSVSDIFCWGNI